MNFFFAPVTAFADNASMHMLAGRKDLIGRLRLGGTIGFAICAPLAGILVQRYDLSMAFWGGAGLIFTGFLVSQMLVHGTETKTGEANQGRVSELLKNPLWLLFLLSAFTCGFAFAGTNTYLFPYMRGLGAKESLMGIALAFGTIAEFPILLFVNRFVKRIKAFDLLLFSMFMTALRLLLFAAAGHPNAVLLVQLLNGFNYPLTWVAGVSFADEHAPAGYRATAQGLFSTVGVSFGSSVGGFIGGLILAELGARTLYLVFGGIVLLVTGLVWAASRRMISAKPVEKTGKAVDTSLD
jgi:PPP family 3-phenylpropionic acid transporter